MKALRRERRRGVSPVIATLLLIVIAVAAAVLVYMWAVGYATQMKPTTPETGERLKIEAGKLFRETRGAGHDNVNATLYVRNVGGSPVYINGSYLLTTSQDVVARTLVTHTSCNITVNHAEAYLQPLEVGEVYMVNIRFDNAWPSCKPGGTYIVRIVTSLGNEFAIELKLQPTS